MTGLCVFALVVALAALFMAGMAHSIARRALTKSSRYRLDAYTYTDKFVRRVEQVEKLVKAAFEPKFVRVPAKWSYMLRPYPPVNGEPVEGPCPKCGEPVVMWPNGAQIGECGECELRRKYPWLYASTGDACILSLPSPSLADAQFRHVSVGFAWCGHCNKTHWVVR